MQFKSLIQLLDYFKEEKTCIAYAERMRWNGKPFCPHCKKQDYKPYRTTRGFKCSNPECYKKFTVRVGSIFESSKIPFRTWFAAIYLCTGHKKGISSVQLSIDLKITQKTAWYILHRVREMLKNQAPELIGGSGPVEVDESYVGGKEENRHKKKKRSEENPDLAVDGTPYNKKKVVVGIVERGGQIALKYVPNASGENILNFIHSVVPKGSPIYSDEFVSYVQLKNHYSHKAVNHSLKIYVTGNNVHTNTIENFWSVLKRGIYGIYHQVSEKHFQAYLNEYAARYNARQIDAFTRFEEFMKSTEGGLLYKVLTYNPPINS